jgi:hypothetical protein
MPALITYVVEVVPYYKDEWIQVLEIDRQTSLNATDNVIGFFVVMEYEDNPNKFNVCIFTNSANDFEKHCETTHYHFLNFVKTNKVVSIAKVLNEPPVYSTEESS